MSVASPRIEEAPAGDRDRPAVRIVVHDRSALPEHYARWEAFVARGGPRPLSYHPAWLSVLERGLGQTPYCLEAVEGDETRGLLPLIHMRSLLFGGFLVGLPYLNYGGVLADDDEVALRLIDRATELADALDVRHLELRHERAVEHRRMVGRPGHKVQMRLPLPATAGELWGRIGSGVRNQVRKGQKGGLAVAWGGEGLHDDFYEVFSRNMRDLGTPVYGRSLFLSAVQQFPGRSEFCVVRAGREPIAAALLIHGWGVTEVPSASSLKRYNRTCANMMMYWNLLERAVERGQATFDFGRSTPGGPVFRFKKQWGAEPAPAEWQYDVRRGEVSDVRPDHSRYRCACRVWRRLPLGLTRRIGPRIVRGIP